MLLYNADVDGMRLEIREQCLQQRLLSTRKAFVITVTVILAKKFVHSKNGSAISDKHVSVVTVH